MEPARPIEDLRLQIFRVGPDLHETAIQFAALQLTTFDKGSADAASPERRLHEKMVQVDSALPN